MSSGVAISGRAVLKPRRSGPFFARHPWVLDASLQQVEGAPADGDVVDLVTHDRQFVARGIFNAASRIRVRLYSWREEEWLDEAFWRRRLAAAVELRRRLGLDDPRDAARLVFSEADGLSGLIVDRYGDRLVLQLTAKAMAARLDALVALLEELVGPASIAVRTDAQVAQAEGMTPVDGAAYGDPPCERTTIEQGGLRFLVDLRGGQKTGFYLDQRENRLAAAKFARGQTVLDVCCYSGAFGLLAAGPGQAEQVLGIDSSGKAIELARENAALNGLSNVSFEVGDCFKALEQLGREGREFGVVILDPPRFAGSRRVVEQALSAYERLNRLAVGVLSPGGILVTCSCSGHVTRELFRDVLASVAPRTGREIQILDQRGAAPDHPVSATCPESEYLKCLICRVM